LSSNNNTELISKSLSAGIVPDWLKTAKVMPIYKSKDKEQLQNYKAISLLPSRKNILKRLYNFLLSQSVFYQSQYGFRPMHSSTHAIHEFVDQAITSSGEKKPIIGVFL